VLARKDVCRKDLLGDAASEPKVQFVLGLRSPGTRVSSGRKGLLVIWFGDCTDNARLNSRLTTATTSGLQTRHQAPDQLTAVFEMLILQ